MNEEKYFLTINLQFFAEGEGGEKTEEATPKKLKDAREEGRVAKSNELSLGVSLLTLFLVLKVFLGMLGEGFMENFKQYFSYISEYSQEEYTNGIILNVVRSILSEVLLAGLPIFVCAVVAGIAVNLMQVKWKVTTKPLMPKGSKINPISGFKKMFSKDKIFELIKAVIKIGLIFYLSYSELRDQWKVIYIFYDYSVMEALEVIGDIIISLGLKISLFFVIIGIGDLIYQKFKFKKELRMSKQEIKDEFKQSEGDPQIKGRIRSKMQEASRARMMKQLPEADVVITNPTHLSVAIKYDKEQNSAPVVIAKGADYLAMKIREVAKENDIVIVENKPLARMLYHNVELGDEIPQELYQMVAEVLVYVYEVKNKMPVVE